MRVLTCLAAATATIAWPCVAQDARKLRQVLEAMQESMIEDAAEHIALYGAGSITCNLKAHPRLDDIGNALLRKSPEAFKRGTLRGITMFKGLQANGKAKGLRCRQDGPPRGRENAREQRRNDPRLLMRLRRLGVAPRRSPRRWRPAEAEPRSARRYPTYAPSFRLVSSNSSSTANRRLIRPCSVAYMTTDSIVLRLASSPIGSRSTPPAVSGLAFLDASNMR